LPQTVLERVEELLKVFKKLAKRYEGLNYIFQRGLFAESGEYYKRLYNSYGKEIAAVLHELFFYAKVEVSRSRQHDTLPQVAKALRKQQKRTSSSEERLSVLLPPDQIGQAFAKSIGYYKENG